MNTTSTTTTTTHGERARDAVAFMASVVRHAYQAFEFDTSAPVPCEPEAVASTHEDGRDRLQRAMAAALAETPHASAILGRMLNAPTAASLLDRMTVGLLVRDRSYTEHAARALAEILASPGGA